MSMSSSLSSSLLSSAEMFFVSSCSRARYIFAGTICTFMRYVREDIHSALLIISSSGVCASRAAPQCWWYVVLDLGSPLPASGPCLLQLSFGQKNITQFKSKGSDACIIDAIDI